MAANGALKEHYPDIGLLTGLGLAFTALKTNLPDGVQSMAKSLQKDKVFCAFLGASVVTFSGFAGHELLSLRRQAAEDKLRASPSSTSLATINQAAEATKAKAARKRREKKFDAKQFMYLLRIAMPSWRSKGASLLGVQFFLLVMRTFITVKTVKISVHYLTKSITGASWKYWVRWLSNFMGWMAMGTTVNSGLRYMESLIALELRQQLTRHAHQKYMNKNAFYRMAVLKTGGLDNVNERIVADIEAWSRTTAFLYGHSFKPVLEFTLSLLEASQELGLARPAALFVTQFLVAGGVRRMMPPIGAMVAQEQAMEAEFRRAHFRLVSHAEEVAFLQGGAAERSTLDHYLGNLMSTHRWNNLLRIRKSAAENFAKFQGMLIGGVFVHIPFLARPGLDEAQRISSFRATEELMLKCGGAFTELMTLDKQLLELTGYSSRISELFQALDAVEGGEGAAAGAYTDTSPDGEAIQLVDLQVDTPRPAGATALPDLDGMDANACLVQHLNLHISAGQNVLVTGPNGCGKTSLFRVLAGLWPPTSGSVLCPRSQLMWLPQKPYLVMGTLRDQVAYPTQLGFSRRQDSAVQECLARAGLAKLADCPDGLSLIHAEWDDVLSGGERQRMGFARLFFHQPMFAVLDEATSAINPEGELALYDQVSKLGVTVFSIAHRMELRKFHQHELQIAGTGTGQWKLLPLSPPAPTALPSSPAASPIPSPPSPEVPSASSPSQHQPAEDAAAPHLDPDITLDGSVGQYEENAVGGEPTEDGVVDRGQEVAVGGGDEKDGEAAADDQAAAAGGAEKDVGADTNEEGAVEGGAEKGLGDKRKSEEGNGHGAQAMEAEAVSSNSDASKSNTNGAKAPQPGNKRRKGKKGKGAEAHYPLYTP